MNAIPITPETPPQFPCWLLTRIISGDPKIWCRAKTNPGGLALSYCSHWHPDQPAAPIAPPTPSVMDKLTEETERLGLYDTVVPPPAPQTTEEEIDFIKYRFPSREAYQQWCEDMVTKIYYAQIAMNDAKIREVVAEIGIKLWLQEGVDLYGSPTPQESPVGRKGEILRRELNEQIAFTKEVADYCATLETKLEQARASAERIEQAIQKERSFKSEMMASLQKQVDILREKLAVANNARPAPQTPYFTAGKVRKMLKGPVEPLTPIQQTPDKH